MLSAAVELSAAYCAATSLPGSLCTSVHVWVLLGSFNFTASSRGRSGWLRICGGGSGGARDRAHFFTRTPFPSISMLGVFACTCTTIALAFGGAVLAYILPPSSLTAGSSRASGGPPARPRARGHYRSRHHSAPPRAVFSAVAQWLMASLPLEQRAQGSVLHAGLDASTWVLRDPIWDLSAAARHAAVLVVRAGPFCSHAASFAVCTRVMLLACACAVRVPLAVGTSWWFCTVAMCSCVAARRPTISLPLELACSGVQQSRASAVSARRCSSSLSLASHSLPATPWPSPLDLLSCGVLSCSVGFDAVGGVSLGATCVWQTSSPSSFGLLAGAARLMPVSRLVHDAFARSPRCSYLLASFPSRRLALALNSFIGLLTLSPCAVAHYFLWLDMGVARCARWPCGPGARRVWVCSDQRLLHWPSDSLSGVSEVPTSLPSTFWLLVGLTRLALHTFWLLRYWNNSCAVLRCKTRMHSASGMVAVMYCLAMAFLHCHALTSSLVSSTGRMSVPSYSLTNFSSAANRRRFLRYIFQFRPSTNTQCTGRYSPQCTATTTIAQRVRRSNTPICATHSPCSKVASNDDDNLTCTTQTTHPSSWCDKVATTTTAQFLRIGNSTGRGNPCGSGVRVQRGTGIAFFYDDHNAPTTHSSGPGATATSVNPSVLHRTSNNSTPGGVKAECSNCGTASKSMPTHGHVQETGYQVENDLDLAKKGKPCEIVSEATTCRRHLAYKHKAAAAMRFQSHPARFQSAFAAAPARIQLYLHVFSRTHPRVYPSRVTLRVHIREPVSGPLPVEGGTVRFGPQFFLCCVEPNLLPEEKVIANWHDKCCFHGNDFKTHAYLLLGQQILQKKSKGHLIHVSGFINSEDGRLALHNEDGNVIEEVREIIYPGANGDA
ncbi:hypothetical protein BU15DRAFT_67321 [Melanogaster broomeanus]|nr:hypothetical protein BU15DRAFT_67321 [Melanogaster broomeanus]